MSRFFNEQEIAAIFFPGDGVIEAGEGECSRITVSLEHDSCWLIVWNRAGSAFTKWNMRMVEGVQLKENH